MRGLLVLVVLAAFATFASAGDVDELAESVESLSPCIHSVTWNYDSSVRIVLLQGGYEHVETPVYVQWLSPPTPDEEPKVLRTVRLTKLDMHSWSELVVTLELGITTAIFSGTHTYSRADAKAQVRIGAPGEVEIDLEDAL